VDEDIRPYLEEAQSGGAGESRTPDKQFRKLLLYPSESVARDLYPRGKITDMEVKLQIPDDIAKRLSAAGADVSRRALDAVALEGYRDQTLTVHQVSEMLGLSRV
jgi:hypothetical protein